MQQGWHGAVSAPVHGDSRIKCYDPDSSHVSRGQPLF